MSHASSTGYKVIGALTRSATKAHIPASRRFPRYSFSFRAARFPSIPAAQWSNPSQQMLGRTRAMPYHLLTTVALHNQAFRPNRP